MFKGESSASRAAAKLRAEAQNLAAVAVKLEVRWDGALRARSGQFHNPVDDGLHIVGGQVGHGRHGHGTPHALAAFLYLGAQQGCRVRWVAVLGGDGGE